MVVIYFDESGHSSNTNFVTMAGLVAHKEQWSALESKWKEALRSWKLTEWHTTHYANSLREYAEWKGDKEKRREAYGEFVDLIRQADAVPLGATVSISGWKKMSEMTRRALIDPYYLVLQSCLQSAHDYRTGMASGDKMLVVFDDTQEFKGRIPKIYEALREGMPYGDQLLEKPCFVSAGRTPQMQAADIVAYEVRQFQDNSLTKPHLPPRWCYVELIKMALRFCKYGPVPWFGNYGEEQLAALDVAVCSYQTKNEQT
jgi:Protein of unknown function (DUF3800)